MSHFKTGMHLSIELESKEPPFRYHGTFMQEDDEYIQIRGTVGDSINRILIIPKTRIKCIDAGK